MLLLQEEILRILWKKLPDWMSDSQRNSKIANLLSELIIQQKIINDGNYSHPKWVIFH
jgi:ATP-dependent DNA helicase RecG